MSSCTHVRTGTRLAALVLAFAALAATASTAAAAEAPPARGTPAPGHAADPAPAPAPTSSEAETRPTAGDFDGDDKTEPAVLYPTEQVSCVRNSATWRLPVQVRHSNFVPAATRDILDRIQSDGPGNHPKASQSLVLEVDSESPRMCLPPCEV